MTRFERSGHWRTNAHGTTFWVSAHDVSRDGWDRDGSSAIHTLPAVPLVSTSTTSSNLTIPNACCPVCGATVFFFKAANGGRVFFDPPLGPPWPKHGCTISERTPLVRYPFPGVAPRQADDGFSLSVHPRLAGTILGIHPDDGSEASWVRADLDLRRRYFERVWPMIESGIPRMIEVITDDLDPVRLEATPCDEPPGMTSAESSELSRDRVADCVATLKAIPGVAKGVSAYSKATGAFAVGMLGGGRVCVLFQPVDVHDDDEFVDDAALSDVAERWKAIKRLLAVKDRLRGSYVDRDQLVVLTDDPLGRMEGWFDDGISTSVDGELEDLGVWAHTNARPLLDEERVGAVCFAEPGRAPRCEVVPRPMSCEDAVRFDGDYAFDRWAKGSGARWASIRRALRAIGREASFVEMDRLLKASGWEVHHETNWEGVGREHFFDLVYVRRSAPKNGTYLRLHYELTVERKALAMIGVRGDAEVSDGDPVTDQLHLVRNDVDIGRMCAAMGFKLSTHRRR